MSTIPHCKQPRSCADPRDQTPACLVRDNLTSPYFPNTSRSALATLSILCAIFVLTSVHRLNHTDLWGHVNFGRWIAEHGSLPAADPIAANPGKSPVLQTAWLSQVAAYHTHRHFGNEGLVFGHALLVTLTAAVLVLAVVRRGAPLAWAWTAAAAMFVLDLPIVGTIRPQLFGQLGASLFLLACSELPTRRHSLIWLPLVAMLWANLHGSILIGMTILGVHAIAITWRRARALQFDAALLVRERPLYVVWGALLLVVGAACLNPHGALLFLHTLTFNDHPALGAISEWRPLSPLSLTGLLMIASTGLLLAAMKWSSRKWELHEYLLLIIFGLATLSAIRMLAWWAIVWPWVCIPHAAAAVESLRDRKREGEDWQEGEQRDQPTAMRTVLATGVVFFTIVVAPPTFSVVAGHGRGEGLILSRETPLYVAEEAARRGVTGSIAAPLDWADFLHWRTEGRLQPLVHCHVHLAEPQAWQAYRQIYHDQNAWLEALHANNVRFLLVSRKRTPHLARQVVASDRSGQGHVRIVYQDLQCVLAEVAGP